MSYSTIYQCANDQTFLGRITACAAQEHAENPTAATNQLHWAVASATDIEAAYASAIAAGNPNPGGDPSVITDQMILSAVQANWNLITPPVP